MFVFTSSVFSEKKYYKHEDSIKNVLSNYFEDVDAKNPDGMLKVLTPEFFLHYGKGPVTTINVHNFMNIYELKSLGIHIYIYTIYVMKKTLNKIQ